MTHTLRIPYDDSVLLETSLSQEEFEREAAFLLAAKLYELGRLSSGKAAELCGKGRVEFLLVLSHAGVPMSNLRPEDVEERGGLCPRRVSASSSTPVP
jgi:predicted HTH domain antitoxin